MREINLIVVHCADTPPSMDIGAKEIDRWHRQRGWLKIGYHYVIRRNGVLEYGRPESEVGAHVKGWNKNSIGICLVGGAAEHTLQPENNFTPEQFKALRALLYDVQGRYTGADIKGHCQLNLNKQCPCFDVPAFVKDAFV